MTTYEIIEANIIEKHRDDITWLESNNFKGEFDKRTTSIIYKTEKDYGNVKIYLYEDGDTSIELDADSLFSADDEIEKLRVKLDKKYNTIVDKFEEEEEKLSKQFYDKIDELDKRMIGKIKDTTGIIPLNLIILNAPHHFGERDLEIEYQTPTFSGFKSNKTAQEIYENLEKAVKLLEDKF